MRPITLALAFGVALFGAAGPAPARDPVSGAGTLFVLDIRDARVLAFEPASGSLRLVARSPRRGPDGVAVDAEAGRIYWTTMGRASENDGAVLRADLDGGNVVPVIAPGLTFTPKQLRLDAVGRKLYWSDREGMAVMRSDLDGGGVETLVRIAEGEEARADRANHAVGIAVDTRRRQLYWSQKGPSDGGRGSIRRVELDAAPGTADIEVLFSGLPEPIDLELDDESGWLYWTDRGDNTLSRARVAGSGSTGAVREILADGLGEAIGVALDRARGMVYVSNLEGTLFGIPLDGSPPTSLLTGEGALTGLAWSPASPGSR